MKKYLMQKFESGDYVRIIATNHRNFNEEAIVQYSYADSDSSYDLNGHRYKIYIKGSGGSAWHNEKDLELIEYRKRDLLYQWEAEMEIEKSLSTDLDYIFINGKTLSERCLPSVCQTLADCLGVGNLHAGDTDGGFFYWAQNSQIVMNLATPFLVANDKQGWLNYCEAYKNKKPSHSNN